MNKDKLIVAANKELYDTVRASYKVNLKKSDGEYWGSEIVRDTVIITHSRTNHPIASFTHELLHIDAQLKGYRRLFGGAAINMQTHLNLADLCTCLDNEFQHHKMFSSFIAMGFPPNEFYADSDEGIAQHLMAILQKTNLPLIRLAIHFFSLIAPGGSLTPEEKEELFTGFYNYENKAYRDHLHRLAELVEEWRASDQFEIDPYIISLFDIIGAGPTWITYRDTPANFPYSGFFTSTEFTELELIEAHNSQ